MNWIKKIGRVAAVAVAMLCFVGIAQAGTDVGASVSLSATMVTSITMDCTPLSVSWGNVPLAPGYLAAASTTVSCVINFTVPVNSYVTLYEGFASSTALSGSSGTVPTSDFYISDTLGGVSSCNNGNGTNLATPGDGLASSSNLCAPIGGGSGNYNLNTTAYGATAGVGTYTDVFTFFFSEPSGLVPGSLSGTFLIDVAWV